MTMHPNLTNPNGFFSVALIISQLRSLFGG
jgi:hypothetical protein